MNERCDRPCEEQEQCDRVHGRPVERLFREEVERGAGHGRGANGQRAFIDVEVWGVAADDWAAGELGTQAEKATGRALREVGEILGAHRR